ncbi:hypothetical protein Tco_0155553 [Tanacetum coccineum]
MNCLSGVDVAIFDELFSSITQVVNLFLNGKCPKMLDEYIASAPLTPLVKPGVFGVGVLGGREAILHEVNRLSEDRGDDVGLSILLVDFKNAFNLVDREVMLQEIRIHCPVISRWVEFSYSSPTRLYYVEHTLRSYQGAWYLDDDTIIGDTLVVGEVLKVIIEDGPRRGLHLNVDKSEGFLPKEDLRNRFAVFSPNIARPLHGVKLLGGPANADFDFSSKLVIKRVAKSIDLMDVVFKQAQRSFDAALRSVLERIVIASGPGFSDWLLQSIGLQTKLLWHSDIVTSGPAFDNALSAFNEKIEIDILSNPSKTMNGRTYRCVLCYRLGVPLFSIPKSCSACSRVFAWDIYGDHVVSCAGIVGIKHRHNIMHDTLVDICFWSRISAGKEVDIGLGSSPLTQTGIINFVPGHAVIEASQRKRVKYEDKCANIGYGFLPFSISSFGELEKDAVTLLKWIQKFSVTQNIRARTAIHIFSRISFAIARGVEAQIVSRLPTNFL